MRLRRETGQQAAVLSTWQDEFLEGDIGAPKRRTNDPKVAALEKELKRAKRMVGDLMMDKELLEMRIARTRASSLFCSEGRIRELNLLGPREVCL